MRQLTLTNEQFEVLFDILRDTVEYLESDLVTTEDENGNEIREDITCLLYTSPSPRDRQKSRMPSSA